MDIHKPRPIHGWRDFIKEIGTIVIGVSIALAAEQAVEKWRQHRQYLEARSAIRDELEVNIANIKRRDEFAACIRHRLDEVGALLDKAANHETFEAPSWIGPAQSLRVRFAAEPEVGKSDLFSTSEARGYSRAYSYLHSVEVEQDRERLAWSRLRMLEGSSHLTPELITVLRVAHADARFEYERGDLVKAGAIAMGDQIGVGHDAAAAHLIGGYQVSKWAHCLPLNTPRAVGERLSTGRFVNTEVAR